MSALPATPDALLALLDSIRLDRQPCLIDKMYQTAEQRAGYAKHMAFMDAGKNYRQRLFMAGNRVGKALKHGTLVMTPNGYRPIESLCVGDAVIDGEGKPTHVVGVYPQGEVDLYRVTFDKHTSVECCGEHLWYYLPPKARYPMRHSHGKWEKNPSFGKWTIGNTKELVQYNLGRAKQRPIVPVTKTFEFSISPLPVDPYVLGVLLGDGGMSGDCVKLSSMDDEIVASVEEFYTIKKYSGNNCDYGVNGAISHMKQLGLAGLRSHEKFIPGQYLYADANSRLAVLQGLMDTDGSIHGHGNMEYCTNSDALCEGFMWLCASLGIKARKTLRHTKSQDGAGKPSWRVSLRGGDVCPFKLKRKAAKWINAKETHDWVVHSIEPCGRGLATCIEVDSPCHTYVLEHGIVTHNTEGAGGYELAMHLTGRYPSWWKGRMFYHPITAWAAGDTRETTRDILQKKIIGEKGKLPEALALVHPSLIKHTSAGFITDSFSSVKVQHASGGLSTLHFKSYDQGREAFQGTEVDVTLLDEEPPLDVYNECLTRTMTNDGMIMLTFTPLRGMSETVLSFFPDNDIEEGERNGRFVVMAGWDDAPHLTEQAKQEMLATYPPFMRLARSRGLPQMGAGVIYPVDQASYMIQPFEIPDNWKRAFGMDVGWNCTAAVWGAFNEEEDRLVIYSEHYAKQATPLENSHGIKGRGAWIPGVIDPASAGANQKDGTTLIGEYQGLGLDLTPADNSVEAGIMRVWTLLSTGKLQIFSNCVNLLRELRGYIRDEKGRVVKTDDHCFTHETLVQTEFGPVEIGSLEGKSIRVVSRNGAMAQAVNVRLTRCDTHVVKVLFSDGTSARCTPDHKFYVDFAGHGGWMEARNLKGKTLRVERELSWSKLFRRLSKNLMGMFTGSAGNTTSDTGIDCTESFGFQPTEKYQKDITSTTLTETRATTALKTSLSCQKKSTCLYTCMGARKWNFRSHAGMLPQFGMGQNLEGLGICNTTRSTSISYTKNTLEGANSAEKTISVESLIQGSAQTIARQSIAKRLELTMRNALALCVVTPLRLISTLKQRLAQERVGLKCVGVIDRGETADVYCMDVPGLSAFTLGNGVLVHNCADAMRYLCMSGKDVAKYPQQAQAQRKFQQPSWVA